MQDDTFIPSLEKRASDFLHTPTYRPMRQHELAAALNLAPDERRELRRILRRLEAEGRVTCARGNRWTPVGSGPEKAGVLHMNTGGFGFVVFEESNQPDLYVSGDRTETALHGDRVMIEVIRGAIRRQGDADSARPARDEARVLRVIERKRPRLCGLLVQSPYYAYVIPDDKRVQHDVRVRNFAEGLNPRVDRNKVMIELDPWEDRQRPLQGTVIEDLGPADSPGIDMLSLLKSYGLDETFPDEVVAEAEAIRPCPQEADWPDRVDLRPLPCLTIDPADAKDFDDAVSLEQRDDGILRLGVHIADVAAFVVPGSAIDREALRRGCTIYLVDRVVSMLPGRLTREVCSLVPGQDRLTHSILLDLDSSGEVQAVETCRSVIRSSARLDYETVQAVLEGQEDPGVDAPTVHLLRDMQALAKSIRRRRMADGALDFTLPEIKCILDRDGKVREIRKRMPMASYQLIEEFMLLANRQVAMLLQEKQRPAIYRIHEEPDELGWASMSEALHALGVNGPLGDREALTSLLEHMEESSGAVYLAVLRNLKHARYVAYPEAHFGLAFPLYTHFTSPIRRYPDLVIHRLLSALEDGAPTPSPKGTLENIALACSQNEENAEQAERDSVDIKRLEFYRDKLARGENGPYAGAITGIANRGLIVELLASLQRGMVAFADLHDDHYLAEPERAQATGQHGNKSYRIGQLLDLELTKVDMERRRVDFRLYGTEPDRRGKRGRSHPAKRSPKPASPRRSRKGRKRR